MDQSQTVEASVKGQPKPRLLITQIQATMSRISIRDDFGIDPLSAMFYLHDRYARVEDSIRASDSAGASSALGDLYAASVGLADGYGVSLKKAYQGLGLDVSVANILTNRRANPDRRQVADLLLATRTALTEIVKNIGLYEIGYGTNGTTRLPPLREAIPQFQMSLLDIGVALDIDLYDTLTTAFRLRTMEGLSRGGYNPLYARTAQKFDPIINRTYCPFATTARLWGAPEFDRSSTVRHNVVRATDSLIRFTRAARREMLDGFVFAFPAVDYGGTMTQLAGLLHDVIETLMELDPVTPRRLRPADVLRPDWRFNFNGEDYFVPVFAPLYGQDHSRYTYNVSDTVFILLQPNSSFHARLGNDKGRIRRQIRERFNDGLQNYDTSTALEAHRFLLPRRQEAVAPNWYNATTD